MKTYREWNLKCSACQHETKCWLWNDDLPTNCSLCLSAMWPVVANVSTGIATDLIPGGLLVKNGPCWPDGTPRRFDSKTELKRAANEAGWTIAGDTPKDYKVNWSGKRIDNINNRGRRDA